MSDRGEVHAVAAVESPSLRAPLRTNPKGKLRIIWLSTAILGTVVLWLAVRPLEDLSQARAPRRDAEPPAIEAAPVEDPETPVAVVPMPALPVIEPAPTEQPLPEPQPVATADDRPITPDMANDAAMVDVGTQLSLPIVEYKQAKPVAVRLLLQQVAEWSAVPVDFSEVDLEPWNVRLDQAVSVELKTTTVGGVFDEVLRQAGLAFRHQDGVIFITPPVGPES